jgi:putative hydrolase of the HAD superfamily
MAELRDKKHIFFDLDDTLWDFERNSGEVLKELYEEHGLAGRLNTDFNTFQNAYRELNLSLWTRYYKREIDKVFLRNNRFQLVFCQYGYDDYAHSLRISEEYLLRAPKRQYLKEGCIDLLQYLKGRYQLHIITNGFTEVQNIKIDTCGLRSFFKHIIISEEHGLVKPEEKIFRLGESLASAKPEDCVMIGDNFDSDITGGLNAGWDVVYFNRSDRKEFEGRRIASLGELKAIF